MQETRFKVPLNVKNKYLEIVSKESEEKLRELELQLLENA